MVRRSLFFLNSFFDYFYYNYCFLVIVVCIENWKVVFVRLSMDCENYDFCIVDLEISSFVIF